MSFVVFVVVVIKMNEMKNVYFVGEMMRMTSSESSFRKWCKEEFPGCFVVKWPDFKVTGLSHSAGVPDFLVVSGGRVWFVEVKRWNARSFTPAQKKVFNDIIMNGGVVMVWVKERRGFSYFNYLP